MIQRWVGSWYQQLIGFSKHLKKCIHQLKSIETFKVGTKLHDTGNQEQSFEKPVPEQKKNYSDPSLAIGCLKLCLIVLNGNGGLFTCLRDVSPG